MAIDLQKSIFFEWIGTFGSYVIFTSQAIKRTFTPRLPRNLILAQMEFIGVRSIGIISLAAVMIGGVFAIQFGEIFRLFGAEAMIGAAASYALSKELAPVITAFLVTGRAGSAMTAELGSMKVNEQIDAMRVMAVNPISYLASPRLVASIIMLPLLSVCFLLTGVLSSYAIGVYLFEVDKGVFIEKIRWLTKPRHIFQGLEKAIFFGAVFSSISCFKGFQTSGGAKGVGKATTEAVVLSLIAILIGDFFITYWQVESKN